MLNARPEPNFQVLASLFNYRFENINRNLNMKRNMRILLYINKAHLEQNLYL